MTAFFMRHEAKLFQKPISGIYNFIFTNYDLLEVQEPTGYVTNRKSK